MFFAGVFSGALSTVSSGLNSLAAVVLQDLCVSAANKQFSEKTKIILTKSLAAGFGCLSYVVVFWSNIYLEYWKQLWEYLELLEDLSLVDSLLECLSHGLIHW